MRIFLILLTLLAQPVTAAGLVEIYLQAVENDPTWQAAIKEREADSEYASIARAGLLPKAGVNYQNTPYNRQERNYDSVNAKGKSTPVTRKESYRSYSASLTVTQPLFDYDAWTRYQMGQVQTAMADERYRAQLATLASRVISGYLEAVFARDSLLLARQQTAVLDARLEHNRRLLAAGEGSVTDLEETRARHSLAEVEVLDARERLEAALRELEAMTGIAMADNLLPRLREGQFTPTPLRPASVEGWEQLAMKRNPALAATRRQADIARLEIARSQAGFMPSVQLYASRNLSDSASDSTVDQQYDTASIGIQMSMPLFGGGETLAMSRQAAARYGQAKFETEAQHKKLLNALRQNYSLCARGRVRLAALTQRLRSADIQLDATRKSMLAGQRTNLDVLDAEQQRFRARIDLLSAKYEYLKARAGLLSDAGVLDLAGVKEIGGYFDVVN